MAPGLVDDAATTKVLRVRPQPDAVEALTMIREAGSWAVTLTNGAAERIRRLLEGSDGVLCGAELSIDAIGEWKPAPEVYRYAAQVTGTPLTRGRLALISAHAHDCDGARRACLRAGQVNRVAIRELSFLQPADAEATDLPGVVWQLLAQ